MEGLEDVSRQSQKSVHVRLLHVVEDGELKIDHQIQVEDKVVQECCALLEPKALLGPLLIAVVGCRTRRNVIGGARSSAA